MSTTPCTTLEFAVSKPTTTIIKQTPLSVIFGTLQYLSMTMTSSFPYGFAQVGELTVDFDFQCGG